MYYITVSISLFIIHRVGGYPGRKPRVGTSYVPMKLALYTMSFCNIGMILDHSFELVGFQNYHVLNGTLYQKQAPFGHCQNELDMSVAGLWIGNHPYITSAKNWVGGYRKLSVLQTFSTVFMLILTPVVGGWVKNVQNYTEEIYGWYLVLISQMCNVQTLTYLSPPLKT